MQTIPGNNEHGYTVVMSFETHLHPAALSWRTNATCTDQRTRSSWCRGFEASPC